MRILIAVDLPDGRQWLRDRGHTEREFVIVTPRAPDRARGYTADAVEHTGSGSVLGRRDRERIWAAIAPSLIGGHRYDPETYRCTCGALDHPELGWVITA